MNTQNKIIKDQEEGALRRVEANSVSLAEISMQGCGHLQAILNPKALKTKFSLNLLGSKTFLGWFSSFIYSI